MLPNHAKRITTACLVLSLYCSAGAKNDLARGEEHQPSTASALSAPAPETKPEDIRPHVRELLKEALEAFAKSKNQVATIDNLSRCAVLQARMGDSEAARETLRKAREVPSNSKLVPVPQTMLNLAKSCADVGDMEQLQEVLKALPDPGPIYAGSLEAYREHTMRECALVLAKAGKGREALDLAKEIKGEAGPEIFRVKPNVIKMWVLRELTRYHARASDLKESRKVLESIIDPVDKVETIAGTIDWVNRPLDLPSEPGIASIQFQAGDRDGARQSLEKAQALVRDVDNAEGKERSLANIACAQAQTGDLAGAQKSLEQIPREAKSYLIAFVAIARAQAAAGQAKTALEAIDNLGTPSDRIYGLSQVAYEQGRAGDVKAAHSAGAKALENALTLPQKEQLLALHEIGFQLARARDIEGALEATSKMSNPLNMYDYIAQAQADGGDTKGALKTLESHKQPGRRPSVSPLAYIARAQAERGEEKEALVWVRMLSHTDAQCACLIGVANGLLRKYKVEVPRP